MGIHNNYNEKLSVPRVQTAADWLSRKHQHHNASIQLKIGEQ